MKPQVFSSAYATSHASLSHGCRQTKMLLLSLLVVGLSGSLLATDIEKANNNNALNTALSYTAGGPPGTSDRILVDSVMVANQSAALGGNLSIAGIFVDATATKALTISGSNTLTLGASGILISSTLAGAGLVFNGPAISLGADQAWDFGSKGTTFSGGTTITENSHALTISSTNQLFFHNSTAMTLNALITGSTALTLDNLTTTSLTLTNAGSTFTGIMAVSGLNTLTASTMNTGGGTSAVGTGQIQLKGGTFKYSGNTATSGQNVVIDSRFVSTLEVTTAGQTLTLSNFKNTNTANSVVGEGANLGGAGNLTITNVIADSTNATRTGTAITKFGSGTMTLSGINTYTGGTTVTTGTLLVNTAQAAGNSGTGSGNVNVTAGTLGGIGIVRPGTGNTVTVNSGAFLAPGDSTAASTIGTLVLDGNGTTSALLAMSSGSKFSFDLGTGVSSDKLNFWNYLTGDFAINANAVDFTLDASVTSGSHTFNLFNFYTNNGVTLSTDIFSGLAFGTLSSNIGAHSFDYTTPGQINLVVTAVPEPATWALLAFSLTTVTVMRRRRKI